MLFCGLCSGSVDHTSSVDSVRGHIGQDMDCDRDVYLRAEVFAAGQECTAGIHSVTSNMIETHRATLCQNVSSIFTHLNM